MTFNLTWTDFIAVGEELAYGIPPPEMASPLHYLQTKASQDVKEYTQPDTRRSLNSKISLSDNTK